MPGLCELAAIVLTLNEEAELAECVAAIRERGIDTILVVDSGSTDQTVPLAKRLGCVVSHRGWTGFADQRNFAVSNLPSQFSHALFVDADERFSAEFFEEIEGLDLGSVDVIQVPSTLFLGSKPLRFAPGYPIYHPRVVARRVVFESNHQGAGEQVRRAEGQIEHHAKFGYEHHFLRSGDFSSWAKKHVDLATAHNEAKLGLRVEGRRGNLSRLAGRPSLRRVLLRLFYHLVVNRGFRDGSAGLTYSLLYAWYELTRLIEFRLRSH